ncbi:MAG: type IV pilus twitching motility protein PilT [SAR324 cluster bacterium]|nr:type IV pilus twitching motility protein PilT [SAR324 cluster bacterium]MBF0350540.1 type IV pilus twitching motility protein PilT [SAR324 cluster bacterium]
MAAAINVFFEFMHNQRASDLHMASGRKPRIRIDGELHDIEYEVLTDQSLRKMLYEIMPPERLPVFKETGDMDFGYEIPGLARYRANYFEQTQGIGAVFREIPSKILTLEQLGLPQVLARSAMLNRGLVLVTGPTGSGKSTTLAAIMDYANKNRRDHIVTIEDPVEFVHESHGCLVNHREVGKHTKSFTAALRAALREDPDIILVGEMRDLETIELAIEAASTGHLVFGTLHTQSATKTVDRIIDVFPVDQQEKVRVTLSETLKVVVAQNLFKRSDMPGRCAALEILICTQAVAAMIREGKTHQLVSMMQTGKKHGMRLLDDTIQELLDKKWISPEQAYEKSMDKKRFIPYLSEPPDELAG